MYRERIYNLDSTLPISTCRIIISSDMEDIKFQRNIDSEFDGWIQQENNLLGLFTSWKGGNVCNDMRYYNQYLIQAFILFSIATSV